MNQRISNTTKWIFISITVIVVFVLLAGMYKFDYLASKEGYDCDGNKIKISTQKMKKNGQSK
jgi:cell division protein YceG involved in septum cleavage